MFGKEMLHNDGARMGFLATFGGEARWGLWGCTPGGGLKCRILADFHDFLETFLCYVNITEWSNAVLLT
jgi:hypothetical protein